MANIEATMQYAKEIESLLEYKLGARGRGFHEKLSSVQDSLPTALVKKMRYVATVRNKLMHEAGYEIDDFERYSSACEEAIDYLNDLAPVAGASRNHQTPAADKNVDSPTLIQGWTTIICFVLGGVIGWWQIGIGAGILFAVVGAILGALASSEAALNIYAQILMFLLGLTILILFVKLIMFLWDFGKIGA